MPSNGVVAIVVSYRPESKQLLPLLNILKNQLSKIYLIDNTENEFKDGYDVDYENLDSVAYKALGLNVGIAEAHNIGIRAAIEDGFNYVLLMDQDSIPSVNMVGVLLSEFLRLQALGINVAGVGPSTIDARTLLADYFIESKRFIVDYQRPVVNEGEPIKADFLISSGCLIPVSVIKEVGFMESDFFIDCVDIEWGFRARSMGYSMYGLPSAVMQHAIGDEHLKALGVRLTMHSPLRHYYFYRNYYNLLFRSYVPFSWKLHVFVRSTIQSVIFLLFAKNGFTHFSMILKGIGHGLIGRLGKFER